MSRDISAKTPAPGESLSLSVGVAGLVFLALALIGHAAAQQGEAETVPFGVPASPRPEETAAPVPAPDHRDLARGVVKGAREALRQVFLEPEGAQPGGTELLGLLLAAAGR